MRKLYRFEVNRSSKLKMDQNEIKSPSRRCVKGHVKLAIGEAIHPASSSLGACVSADNAARAQVASSKSSVTDACVVVYATPICARMLLRASASATSILLIEPQRLLGPYVTNSAEPIGLGAGGAISLLIGSSKFQVFCRFVGSHLVCRGSAKQTKCL
jgi:hypothetical protein